MAKQLMVILLFITTAAKSQNYVANWTGWGHTEYMVQQATDTSSWTTINVVTGTLAKTNYQCVIPGATFYYRIKADNDSTSALLVGETLGIKNNPPAHGKTKTRIATLSVKVSVESQIHYTIQSQRDQLMTYSLYDATGRKVRSKLVPLHIGQNDFFDRKPAVLGVYYGTFEGYFDFITLKIINR